MTKADLEEVVDSLFRNMKTMERMLREVHEALAPHEPTVGEPEDGVCAECGYDHTPPPRCGTCGLPRLSIYGNEKKEEPK